MSGFVVIDILLRRFDVCGEEMTDVLRDETWIALCPLSVTHSTGRGEVKGECPPNPHNGETKKYYIERRKGSMNTIRTVSTTT